MYCYATYLGIGVGDMIVAKGSDKNRPDLQIKHLQKATIKADYLQPWAIQTTTHTHTQLSKSNKYYINTIKILKNLPKLALGQIYYTPISCGQLNPTISKCQQTQPIKFQLTILRTYFPGGKFN